ncbi:MAG TPA: ergothioneine biosynthesis protein EgtB [Terriglobales bacterium]|nr:ergothioneine biosynthesis protein EgtB [Terriglobales bacterium]
MHASRAEQLSCSPFREQYREVRSMTLQLTQPFSAEDQMLQSMPDCSPAKWHKAHTTWFFETFILTPHVPNYKPFDTRFQQLFNSYYKQLGPHPYRGSRGLMSRPTLEEIHAYRAHVDESMVRHLDTADEKTAALVEIGLNHEQQHQELIVTDMKNALWSMPLRPAEGSQARLVSKAPNLELVHFAGGIHEIGHHGRSFAFDNEGPRHKVLLQPFQLASRLATNAEYLEFMNDGGYRRPELWLSDGWDTVCSQRWNSPLYWEEIDGDWFEFTFSGMRELDPAAPVCHVSYYEADAFAHWSKARLPREEEWEVAAAHAARNGTLLESGKLHPQPAAGDGLQQMFGDVWEWTASPYVAYPGFQPAAGAIGEYNGKFMCNQFVLRGGSCATPVSHIRASYRNFFPPHARWQFMGIRLAK